LIVVTICFVNVAVGSMNQSINTFLGWPK